MAYDALIKHVEVRASHVHRIAGEIEDPENAAQQYEHALTEDFAVTGRDELTFDLVLLGLGEDAHIASIFFPNSPLLGSENREVPARRVAAVWAPHLNAWRITLTVAALLDARRILVLTTGMQKAAAVHAALELPEDVHRWPAQLLRRVGGRVEWSIDRPAAQTLQPVPPW
jgi:6-phosphogluconolactonase